MNGPQESGCTGQVVQVSTAYAPVPNEEDEMSGHRILIERLDAHRTRVAQVRDGVLEEMETEDERQTTRRGDLYRGRIEGLHGSLNAAFVDLGDGSTVRSGFLPLDRWQPQMRIDNTDDAPPRRGDAVLVEIKRDAEGTKGPVLTGSVSLAGRSLVLMPRAARERDGGVSRRLDADERREATAILDGLEVPTGMSVIVRTAAADADVDQASAKAELDYLLRCWADVERTARERPAPGCVHREANAMQRVLRDALREDTEAVLVAGAKTAEEVRTYLRAITPWALERVRERVDGRGLLDAEGLRPQAEACTRRTVRLPSGGSIVIDRTEALVAVDVNSGGTRAKDMERIAQTTNEEAAEALARQLRLRNLGGLVAVDFIDMEREESRTAVEATLDAALTADRAPVRRGTIDRFGVLVLSRGRRGRANGADLSDDGCPSCGGPIPAQRAADRVRRLLDRLEIEAPANAGRTATLRLLADECAWAAGPAGREALAAVEAAHQVQIRVEASPKLDGRGLGWRGPHRTAPAEPRPAEPPKGTRAADPPRARPSRQRGTRRSRRSPARANA